MFCPYSHKDEIAVFNLPASCFSVFLPFFNPADGFQVLRFLWVFVGKSLQIVSKLFLKRTVKYFGFDSQNWVRDGEMIMERKTLVLLLACLLMLLSIVLVAGGGFFMESSREGELFTVTVGGEGLILSDGTVLKLEAGSEADSGSSDMPVDTWAIRKFYFKIPDGERFDRALARVMVLQGFSSTGSPVYVGAFRFGGISPEDAEPGVNYVGWLEVDGERFDFIYNVTIESTETVPISGTVPVGWSVPHGNWDMIERISIYLSWQPAAQLIGISIIDNTVTPRSGYGYAFRGGSASASFTPPYDYRHRHSIVIMNLGSSAISYRGTIWVTHRS